ncbi:MAG: 30S ribosomal protein S3 [Bilophila sp.]
MNEIRRPEADSQLVAKNIAQQLQRREAFRRAMKRNRRPWPANSAPKASRSACSWRLPGAEIARTEWYRDGRVPLQTLRADIDYGFAEAHTTYGIIGLKAWISKGEILDKEVER